jgi:hypothetical protein
MKFRLVVRENGRIQAVFEDEEETRGALLSGFLHDAPHFVADVLYEISLVERRAVASSGFETATVDVHIHIDRVVINPSDTDCISPMQVILSLVEAKQLLFQWGLELLRLKNVGQENLRPYTPKGT